MNSLLLVIAIGYVLGCIHGSQLIGKYKRINLKKSGTKNAGASNAMLLLGWRYGFVVALIDIGKALVSLQITVMILQNEQIIVETAMLYLLLNGLFVVLGHNYPMTMQFNGGKGTAAFFGVLLFINWKLAIVSLCIALVIAVISNYFVLGTFAGYVTFTIYISYMYGRGPGLLAFLFTMLFLMKHMENFKRMINNEEVKIRTFFRREAS